LLTSEIELIGAACAILQQRGCQIAAGIHLDGKSSAAWNAVRATLACGIVDGRSDGGDQGDERNSRQESDACLAIFPKASQHHGSGLSAMTGQTIVNDPENMPLRR
jgi:hypothetical protein